MRACSRSGEHRIERLVGEDGFDGGHGGHRRAASQEPEEVPMAALDRISCMAIAGMEFIVG